MPYAPGIEYRGDRYLYQGITSGAQGLTDGIKKYVADKQESKGLDTSIGGMFKLYKDDPEFVNKFGEDLSKSAGMSLTQKRALAGSLAAYGGIKKQEQDAELHKAQIAHYLADTARVNAAIELDKEHNLRTQDAEEQNAIFNRSLGEGLSNPGQPTSSQLQSYYESSSSEQPDLPPAPTNPWMAFGAALQAAPRTTEASKALPNLFHYAGQNQQNGLITGVGEKMRLRGIEAQTGIRFINDDGSIDSAKYDDAVRASGKLAVSGKTPASLKVANALMDSLEHLSGQPLSEEDRAKHLGVYLSSGNRPPPMSATQQGQLNVAEYATDAAAKLLDEIKSHPEVKFGPGVFRFDKAKGEWVANTSEASKIAQLYTVLYGGQAFSQGGKQVTGYEAKLIADQIGDPTQSNFVEKLKTAQRQYLDVLGKNVRDLQDRQFDKFPGWKDYIDRLRNQYESDLEKYGQTASGAYAVPKGSEGKKVGKFTILSVE